MIQNGQTMSSIEDILNADDSDDEIDASDNVDLEQLLHSRDDDEILQSDRARIASNDGKQTECKVTHFDATNNHLLAGFSVRASTRVDPENSLNSLILDDDSSTEGDEELYIQEEKESVLLSSFRQAELRERKFLDSGQKDAVSALQSKRTSHILFNYSNVRCDELSTVSNQLKKNSSYKQHGPGAATSMVVTGSFMAVGTSKGLIILFDHQQEIRSVLGSNMTNDSRPCSDITALDATKLLHVHQSKGLDGYIVCGYATGELALWDVAKGAIVKLVTDLHSSAISTASILDSTSDGLANVGGQGDEANLVGLPSGWLAASTSSSTSSSSQYEAGSSHLPAPMRLGFSSSIASVASSSMQGASLVVVSADREGVMYKTRFSRSMWSSTFTAESECLLDSSTGPLTGYAPLPPLLRSMQTNSAFFYRNKATAADCKACCRYVSAHRSARLLAINVGPTQTWVVQTHPKIKILYKWEARNDMGGAKEEPQGDVSVSSIAASTSSCGSRCLDWTWTAQKQDCGFSDQNPIFVPADQADRADPKEGVDWVPTLARCWGEAVELLCLMTTSQGTATAASPSATATADASSARRGSSGDGAKESSSAQSTFASAFSFLSTSSGAASVPAGPATSAAVPSEKYSSKAAGQYQTRFVVAHRRSLEGQRILSLRWVSSSELVALTTSDVVVTNQALEITEKFSLQPSLSMELHSYFSTTGAGVAASTLSALHNNVCGRILYFCARDTVVAVQMQSCFELADRLTEKGQWLEALALVLENVRRSPNLLQLYGAEVGRYIVRYAELAVKHPGTSTTLGPGVGLAGGAAASTAANTAVSAAQSKNHFHLVSGVCIEYCIACSRLELLFSHVYSIFKSVQRHYVFLEALEPFVLSQEITSLPPTLIAEFCESALRLNRLPSIERCVAYFEIAHLDMNFVTKFLYENKMFSSFLYVYANGLNDFAGAFQIIFNFMLVAPGGRGQRSPRDDEGPSDLADVGYKLLLFLCYSFEGRIFPRGDAMQGAHCDLSWQLLELVTAQQLRPAPSIFSLQSAAELQATVHLLGAYPYLAKLFEVDQHATLHVLHKGVSLVQEVAISRITGAVCDDLQAALPVVYDNILSYCVGADEKNPSGSVETAYFDMFAEVVVNARCSLLPSFLDRFVLYCASNGHERARYEAMLQTLASNQPKDNRDRSSALAALLAQHNFGIASLHACRSVGTSAEQFRRCLAFYIKEGTDRAQTTGLAFQYIGEVLRLTAAAAGGASGGASGGAGPCAGGGSRPDPQSSLIEELLKVIVPLCYLDLPETRRLVQQYLSSRVADIIDNSAQDLKMQFALLNALVPLPAESLPGDRGRQLATSFNETTIIKYFTLLATYDPTKVLDFLVSFEHYYPQDQCTQICQNKGIPEAVAFLMERAGRVLDAVLMLLDDFSAKLKHVRRDVDAQLRSEMAAQAAAAKANLRVGVVEEDRYLVSQILAKEDVERADAAKKLPSFKMLESLISCVADLCSRNSGDDQAGLWLLAFDRLLMERRKCTVSIAFRRFFSTETDISLCVFCCSFPVSTRNGPLGHDVLVGRGGGGAHRPHAADAHDPDRRLGGGHHPARHNP